MNACKYTDSAVQVYAENALEWIYQQTKENKRMLALAETNGWTVQAEGCKARVYMLEWLQALVTREVGKK